MIKTTFIYSLSCPITGEIRYIGKCNNIKIRLKNHINYGKSGKINYRKNWINSLKKLGLKPIIEVLDEVDICEWRFWETHYISLFKSWGFELVNSTKGGEGLSYHGESARKNFQGKNNPMFGSKRSDLCNFNLNRKGKTFEEMYGKEKSDLIKNKMGRKGELSPFSKKILQYDLKGNLIKEWLSVTIASKEGFGIEKSSRGIAKCANGKMKTCYGFIWKYK